MIATISTIAAALIAAAPAQYERNYNPDACRFNLDAGAIVLATRSEQSVAAGETVTLRPAYTTNPGSFDEVPGRCLTDWRVSDPRIARLSRDRKTLTLAPDAREGGEVTVTARYRGQPVIALKVRVIVPVQSPLVGFWTQEGVAACPEASRVFDLVFERSGAFSVALGPRFHGSRDYSGRWRVEGDRLVLSDLTGSVPADMAREVRFTVGADGGLSFDRPWLGTQGERGTCTAPFRKLRS